MHRDDDKVILVCHVHSFTQRSNEQSVVSSQMRTVHRIHTHSVHDSHAVCSQARTDTACVLVAHGQDG